LKTRLNKKTGNCWLFGGLKIGQNPTPLHNRYFILKLNFSMVNPEGDHAVIQRALYQHVNDEIGAFNQRYQDHLPQLIEVNEENAVSSLRRLLTAIGQTPYKLYVLIDEYDNFANEVMISPLHGTNRYEELVQGEGIIKTFFKAIKDGSEGRGIDRVFLIGVIVQDKNNSLKILKNICINFEYCNVLADFLS